MQASLRTAGFIVTDGLIMRFTSLSPILIVNNKIGSGKVRVYNIL